MLSKQIFLNKLEYFGATCFAAIAEQTDLQRPIQTETMTEAWLKTIWRHFPAQKKEGTYVCMSAIYSLATKPQATEFLTILSCSYFLPIPNP